MAEERPIKFFYMQRYYIAYKRVLSKFENNLN
jgi:hypothetical protein